VTDIVAEIAAASREQSSGIEQVNKAVVQMDEGTQQNAALVEEASAASQAIVEQVITLNALVSHYQVKDDVSAPLAAAQGSVKRPRPAAPRAVPAVSPARPRTRTLAAAAGGADSEWSDS
jgi:methyl-accepting chemotaxis protein